MVVPVPCPVQRSDPTTRVDSPRRVLSFLEPRRTAPTKILLVCRAQPNGSRLSCGALKKDSFPNLRAPAASSAC